MKKFIGFFSLPFLLLIACKEEKQNVETTETIKVPTINPIRVDTSIYVDYVSQIQAIKKVEIRARVNGFLDKIYIDEGKNVQKGQVLFRINNLELKQQLSRAEALYKSSLAELEASQLELQNIKRLVEKNIISETEYKSAENNVAIMKAKVDEATANVSSARIYLSYCDIRAPFKGVVNRIPNKMGSLVKDGTLLTTLTQNDEVFAYFDVSEKDYLDMMSGLNPENDLKKPVQLVLANGLQHPYEGYIETTESEIEEGTGSIAFRARFGNPEKLLVHGATGKVRLLKEFDDIIMIPQKSTFEVQNRVYVFVVNEEGVVETRGVKIGNRLNHYFIVDEGLSTTDQVIFEGIQNVRDQMKVETTPVDFRKILSASIASKTTL